jgi:uncharacterized membrane protein YgcG
MTTPSSIHAWFTEQIAAHLANGLTAEDRQRFETHAAECPACAAALADAAAADARFRQLFADVAPSADFEDRVIQRLRREPRHRFSLPRPNLRLHPAVRRAAVAVAATILIAGVGYVASSVMENRQAQRTQVASNLRQIGHALQLYDLSDVQQNLSYSYASPSPDTNALGRDYKMQLGLDPTLAVAANINPGPTGNEHGQNGQNVFRFGGFGGGGGQGGGGGFGGGGGQGGGGFVSLDGRLANRRVSAGTETAVFPLPGGATDNRENPPVLGPVAYFKPDEAGHSAQDQAAKDSTVLVTRNPADGEKEHDEFNSPLTPSLIASTTSPKQSTVPPASPPAAQPAPPVALAESDRKIVRHGEMAFEVDSFDSAFVQISKIVAEEGGFVDSTASQKLDNGKVSGSVVVRVPPEHLDTLVLKLRGIGDLKGQKIVAEDITKEFTDLQSELRAAQAMQDRLLDLIKNGKGQVKDLLAAENELGVWCEKIEKITGQINYDNNLISFSTLEIAVTERDIRQAAAASETENVSMGIETDDVPKARDNALKALDDAKARIIQSDLKQFDAGQLAATIVAEVSPDLAGPVTDRLKQLGRVARLDMTRQQTTPDGTKAPAGVHVERQNTQLQISLYNLANIAPRQTTSVTMACADVEKVYHQIIGDVSAAGGRVVNSALNRATDQQIDATINFETPTEKADAVLADVRLLGEVMHLAVTENPDAANVTAAKRGFVMTLAAMSAVASRQTINASLMPGGSVADAYHAILAVAQADGATVSVAQLQEQNSQSASASLTFDLPRDHVGDIENCITSSLGSTGRVLSRQSARSNDTEHTVDSKVEYVLTLASSDALAPRQTIARVLAVSDVGGAYNGILAAAQQADGKVTVARFDQSDPQHMRGELGLILSGPALDAVEKAIADSKAGLVSRAVSRSPDLNATTDQKTQLQLTIEDLDAIPPRQTTGISLSCSDPEKGMTDLLAAALAAGGRIVDQNLTQNDQFVAHVVMDVPLKSGADMIERARALGTLRNIEQTKNAAVPDADFVHARVDISLIGAGSLVGQDAGIWASFKGGVATSIKGLLYSLELIVIGLCLLLPWVAILWGGWKGFRLFRSRRVSPAVGNS